MDLAFRGIDPISHTADQSMLAVHSIHILVAQRCITDDKSPVFPRCFNTIWHFNRIRACSHTSNEHCRRVMLLFRRIGLIMSQPAARSQHQSAVSFKMEAVATRVVPDQSVAAVEYAPRSIAIFHAESIVASDPDA